VLKGPFEIVDSKPIRIEMRKTQTPLPEPLPPDAMPNPQTLIPLSDRPEKNRLTEKEVKNPGEVVFAYDNQSNEYLRVLLYSFDDTRARNPWRVLPADHCAALTEFNGFTEGSGWFAVVVRKESGSSQYVKSVNMYAKKRTTLTIKQVGANLAFSFD
jgi:hypothetical protein